MALCTCDSGWDCPVCTLRAGEPAGGVCDHQPCRGCGLSADESYAAAHAVECSDPGECPARSLHEPLRVRPAPVSVTSGRPSLSAARERAIVEADERAWRELDFGRRGAA